MKFLNFSVSVNIEGNHVINSFQWERSDDVRKDHDGPLRNVFNTEPLSNFLSRAGQQCVLNSVTATVCNFAN